MSNPVVIIAAMPEELASLLQRMRGIKKRNLAGIPAWEGTLQGKPLLIIRSGMGEKRARAAATAAIQLDPCLLCSIGFGGAVRPGLTVGDLVVGNQLYTLDGTTATPVKSSAFIVQNNSLYHQGSILTTNKIINKQIAAAVLPADLPYPVLEMETAAVATIANNAHVPFLALRAISDSADEELGFSLDEFCDNELNLQLWRVLLTVARKPMIIPQLLRLARNSRIAGRALADGICTLLAIAESRSCK